MLRSGRWPELRPIPRRVVLTRPNGLEGLGIQPDHLDEINKMSGPLAYDKLHLPLGTDLTGQPVQTLTVSLERLMKTAAERNVAVQFARLGPGISQSQIVAAEAAFDWTFFSNMTYQSLDNTTPNTTAFGTPVVTDAQTVSDSVGLRRSLVGGGKVTIQHDFSHTDSRVPTTPNPANTTGFTLQWDQPLLHGYGSEVTQAEIRVDRNAERNAVQTLRRDLMKVLSDTEKAYWDLVQSEHDVLILQRLLERGEKVRDQLKERANIDANNSQIAEATSRVTERQGNLAIARAQVRSASDKLKGLVNDPDFPVGSEDVLIPSDAAVDQPIKFSLLESIRSAIQLRPEVQQAILGIDDASIRQTVARNGRLPDLNLRLQTKWSSLDDDAASAYGKLFNGKFIDYVVGLSFEAPLGYRKGESEYRQRVLERQQSVLAYRNTVQQVVGEVKAALLRLETDYKLIDLRKTSRVTAANALRVFVAEKEAGPGYTVERLDFELQQQERLADAERQEMQAVTDYNAALADLFQAMGTTLEHNNIQFVAPTTSDALEGQHGTKGWAGEPVAKTPRK